MDKQNTAIQALEKSKRIYEISCHKITCDNYTSDIEIVFSYLEFFNQLGLKGLQNVTVPKNFKL
jgi:hypothetical protein